MKLLKKELSQEKPFNGASYGPVRRRLEEGKCPALHILLDLRQILHVLNPHFCFCDMYLRELKLLNKAS